MCANKRALIRLQIMLPTNYSFNIYIYIYIYIYIPTPPHEQDATLGQFFKRILTVLNLEFFFYKTGCHTKVKELGPSYYLPITGRGE